MNLPKTCAVLGRTTELIGYSEAAENSVPVWNLGSPNARRAANKREYETITDEFLGRFSGKQAAP